MKKFNLFLISAAALLSYQLFAESPEPNSVAVAKRPFGAEQVTGKPDTHVAGDIETAWASATADGQDEWLELTYEKTLTPILVHVHETYK